MSGHPLYDRDVARQYLEYCRRRLTREQQATEYVNMNPFPYGVPGEATYAQCDPLIVDLVRRINADEEFHVRTVQSCEGHPFPMLELLGFRAQLAAVAESMLFGLPEKMTLAVVKVVTGDMVDGERWRFTVIPAAWSVETVALARDVLARPWVE